MLSRFGGKVGEYMWEKEMERLERYKDRPWELQNKEADGSPLFVLLIVVVTMAGLLFLASF